MQTETIKIDIDMGDNEEERVRAVALALLSLAQRVANDVEVSECVLLGALITGSVGLMVVNGHDGCAIKALKTGGKQYELSMMQMADAATKQ